MKDKNLTNNYDSLTLEELTIKADKMISDLESEKNLESSIEKYQDLLRLNNVIEKKFKINIKDINEKTKKGILEITSKKNAKTIK